MKEFSIQGLYQSNVTISAVIKYEHCYSNEHEIKQIVSSQMYLATQYTTSIDIYKKSRSSSLVISARDVSVGCAAWRIFYKYIYKYQSLYFNIT